MSTESWSDQENDVIAAVYFQMLGDELAGRDFNKAAHNRSLQQTLGRSKGSIEFKSCNISAALLGFGLSYVRGYQPRFNFQMSLAEAISRWLARNPYFETASATTTPQAFAEAPVLFLGVPPTLQNAPPPAELSQIQAIARKFDVAGRDARNHHCRKEHHFPIDPSVGRCPYRPSGYLYRLRRRERRRRLRPQECRFCCRLLAHRRHPIPEGQRRMIDAAVKVDPV
jgi:hypothetical protein